MLTGRKYPVAFSELSTQEPIFASGGTAVPSFALDAGLHQHILEDYVSAIPLACAIVSFDQDCLTVISANARFGAIRKTGAYSSALTLLDEQWLQAAIIDFIVSDEKSTTFDWIDGDPKLAIGRYYSIQLSRLARGTEYPRYCIISIIDNTVAIQTERALRAELAHDSLTGLPNRQAFTERLQEELDSKRTWSVAVIDLRRFSRVNEALGAIGGDELIITVARRLLSAMRAGDGLARLTGDEFIVMLRHGVDQNDITVAVDRLREALSQPFRLSNLEIRVDCAIGWASAVDNDLQANEIIRNAQFALKAAKRSGKIEAYQSDQAMQAHQRFSLETELRKAIEREELHLAFQPLVELRRNRIIGYEALARWDHPEKGPISPAEFIPVAEESGLILPLGRWVADCAARTLKSWDERAGQEFPGYISVNLSVEQLQRDDPAAMMAQILNRYHMNGKRLTVEVTESVVAGNPEGASQMLRQLKDLGVTVALDDFGTGYSSLAYLQRLPIDILKIDRSFVHKMLEDHDSVAIVRAILSLASALGMRTVAEGIESKQMAQMLAILGCGVGQGYYFSRPVLEKDAFELMLPQLG